MKSYLQTNNNPTVVEGRKKSTYEEYKWPANMGDGQHHEYQKECKLKLVRVQKNRTTSSSSTDRVGAEHS